MTSLAFYDEIDFKDEVEPSELVEERATKGRAGRGFLLGLGMSV